MRLSYQSERQKGGQNMIKNYSGNRKPFVLALLPEDMKEKMLPFFEALWEKGVPLCVEDGKKSLSSKAKRACGVIAVISEGFNSSSNLQSAILDAEGAGAEIIPVLADGSKPNAIIERILFARNAIDASKYDISGLVSRIMTAKSIAEPFITDNQRAAQKRIRRLMIGLGAAALVAAGIFVMSNSKGTSEAAKRREIMDNLNLTEDELEKITSFSLVGNSGFKKANVHEIIVESWNENERTWYYKENEEEVEKGTIADLSFITLMPNLRNLTLVNQTAENLPDLSLLKYLNCVEIIDCEFKSLDGIENNHIETLNIGNTPFESLKELSGCTNLKFANLWVDSVRDLEGLTSEKLQNVTINGNSLETLDGIECPRLKDLTISSDRLKDISALKNCPEILRLTIQAERLTDIGAVGSLSNLNSLRLNNMTNATDISCIESCRELSAITLYDMRNLSDLSVLGKLPKLKEIDTDCGLNNLVFLNGLGEYASEDYREVKLAFRVSDGMTDFSPLSAIPRYSSLTIWFDGIRDFSAAQRQLENSQINELCICNGSNIDLGKLDMVKTALELNSIGDLEDLNGARNETIKTLELHTDNRLKSLDGIEGFTALSNIEIDECVRLTDYKALYEYSLNNLSLYNQPVLPDFSRLQFNDYCNIYIEGETITDVGFIREAQAGNQSEAKISLDISGLPNVYDLSPLKSVKGRMLTVGPQLESQADELVSSGNFLSYKIEYRELSRQDFDFELISFEELDTLMPSLLEKVRRLNVIGDRIGNFDYGGDEKGVYIENIDGTKTYVGEGPLTDFTKLAMLTNLEGLDVSMQPLESLEGIGSLRKLNHLNINNCGDIYDVSPVFALTGLKELWLNDRLESLDGIENLYALEFLELTGDAVVTDLTPLLKLPNLSTVIIDINSNNAEEALASLEGKDNKFEIITEW